MPKQTTKIILRLSLFILLSATTRAQQPAPAPMTIEGTVVDRLTGKPIAGVSIVPPQPPRPPNAPDPRSNDPLRRAYVQSNVDGAFTIGNVGPKDDQILQFRKAGYLDRQAFYTFVPGRKEHMVVRLQPTGVVAGRVFDAKGDSGVDIVVTLYGNAEGHVLAPLSNTLTNDRGEFRLVNVTPGRYFVGFAPRVVSQYPLTPNLPFQSQFFSPSDAPDPERELYPGAGDVSAAEMIDVKGGEEVRLKDIVLGAARLGEIRLHIASAGTDAISEADLVVNGYGNNRSGRARPFHANLESGNTLVRVYRPSGPGIFSAQLNWKQQDGSVGTVVTPIEFTGRDIDVDIAAAKPAGQLEIRGFIDGPQGNPMPAAGAGFTICRPRTPCRDNDFAIKPEFGLSLAFPGLRSDADGVVRLTGIAEGSFVLTDAGLRPPDRSYVVSATQNGHDVLKEGIVVSKAPSIVEVHFKRSVGRIHGTTMDRQGRKLDEGMILLQPEDDTSLQLQYFAEVDRTGSYALGGIRPGRYRAFAWSDARMDQVLDTDFVEKFKGRGIPVTIGENAQISLDLTILDTP